jgi:RecA-family ATPase
MDPDDRLPPSLTSSAFLLDGDISPPDFVIDPFFPCGELTEIVGAHGNFKSTIALDACLSVATGRPWAGVQVKKGRAAFITLEDARWTLARRVRAWVRGIYEPSEIEAAEHSIRANFSFLARDESQGVVLTATRDGVTAPRFDIADHLARITDGVAFLVLETASRLHDGPETNDGFAPFIRALERIVTHGPALSLIRHMSKKASRTMVDADTIDSHAGRGGGALSDAARSVLVVHRKPGDSLGPVTLTVKKATHGEPGASASWVPVVEKDLGAVRLEYRTPDFQAVDEAQQVAAHIRAAGERGVTRSDIHKNPPAGLGRAAALRGLDYLRAHGRVVERQEVRGPNKQLVTVYYAPGVIR